MGVKYLLIFSFIMNSEYKDLILFPTLLELKLIHRINILFELSTVTYSKIPHAPFTSPSSTSKLTTSSYINHIFYSYF